MAPALKTKSRPPGGFPAARTTGPTGGVRGVGEFTAEWRRHENTAAGCLQPTSYTPAWGGDQAGAQQNIPVLSARAGAQQEAAPQGGTQVGPAGIQGLSIRQRSTCE